MPMLAYLANPTANSVQPSAPVSYVVNLTAPVNAATIDATKISVDTVQATSVLYTPGATVATVTFANPVTAQNPHSFAIASGAFSRASDNSAAPAYSATFYVDSTPLQV